MKADTLVVGAGLAGVCIALQARGRVVLLSPSRLGEDCASNWAQGGIAAAFDADDHPQAHARDTIKAGGGIVDIESARLLSENIADAVRHLADIGVPFDRDNNGFTLGREAAHTHARIVRVGGDGAGHAIMKTLIRTLRRCEHVRVLEGVHARDLLVARGRVVGVSAGNSGFENVRIAAKRTVLACGGIGQLYRATTNPTASRGEGIAMAARAGAILADMEFVQFHPTAIDAAGADPLPLATEALRGEGAVLLDRHGTRFLRRVHPLGELAPRDVVARAIQRERRFGPVFLDARDIKDLVVRFPALSRACRNAGIDPSTETVPVLPAAHYHMGGVAIDARGRTSLPGLWACGEVASSGCHGANRLAGNSLGEAIVFAKRIAADCSDEDDFTRHDFPAVDGVHENDPVENSDIESLRDLMSQYVGIERDESGLRFACRKLLRWKRGSKPGGRLSNMSITALLIAASALKRRESRGCHFRLDAATASLPPRRSTITLAQAEDIAAQTSPLRQEEPLSL